MKNRKRRAGSTIGFVDVIRANGTRERVCGKIRNIVSNSIALNPSKTRTGTGTISLSTYTTRIRSQLDGTFSQSGPTITRESGSGTFSPGSNFILQFASGEWAYHTSGSGFSCTVSRSRTVSAQALFRIDSNLDANYLVDRQQNQSFGSNCVNAYSDGVFSATSVNVMAMTPAVTPYTMRRISVGGVLRTGSSEDTYGCMFDLPSDVSVGAGDSVVVGDFEYLCEYDEYEPRSLAECPLTNLTTSCRVQRMIPAATTGIDSRENQTPNRIWLIDDGDEYPLPDMPTSAVNPNVLTVLETIVATGSNTAPSVNNDMTESNSCYGQVVTGGATIKQIAWGTTSMIFEIIEFDTPQNIPAGKTLTLSGHRRMVIDVPAIPAP